MSFLPKTFQMRLSSRHSSWVMSLSQYWSLDTPTFRSLTPSFHPRHPKHQHISHCGQKHEEKTTWGIFSEMGETTWWKYEVTKSYNSRARIPMQWRGSVKTRLSGGPCFSPWSWSSLEVADTRNKIQRAYSTNHHVNLNDNKPAIIVIETIMMMMMMMMIMMMMMMLVVVVMVVVVMVVAVVEMGDELFYDSLWHWKASSNCHSCDRDLLFDHFLDRIKE